MIYAAVINEYMAALKLIGNRIFKNNPPVRNKKCCRRHISTASMNYTIIGPAYQYLLRLLTCSPLRQRGQKKHIPILFISPGLREYNLMQIRR